MSKTLEFLPRRLPAGTRRGKGLIGRLDIRKQKHVYYATFNANASELFRERGYSCLRLAKDRYNNLYALPSKEFDELSSYRLLDYKNPNFTSPSNMMRVSGVELVRRIGEHCKSDYFSLEEIDNGEFKILPYQKEIKCN